MDEPSKRALTPDDSAMEVEPSGRAHFPFADPLGRVGPGPPVAKLRSARLRAAAAR